MSESLIIQGSCEPLDIQAADGDSTKPARFSMVAYTGAAMRVGWGNPVVVDISGIKAGSEKLPVLRQHDSERIVGHVDTVEISQQRLKVSGIMSGADEESNKVIAAARKGFPWQASIGAVPEKTEHIDAGQTVKVNGRNFTGPITVVRAATLREISFVSLGADGATSATVAASFKGENMSEENKVEAPKAAESTINAGAEVAKLRAELAAESARAAAIHAACKDHPLIAAEAVANGWTADKAEKKVLEAKLEELRASRPTPPAGHVKSENLDSKVLEAAICMGRGHDVEKDYKPEVLEAAHKHRNVGIQQLLLMAAAQNGYSAGPGARVHAGNVREVFEHAFLRASGFSTVSLPNMLGNVANKEALMGYMEEDMSWKEVSRTRSVSNFHAVNLYRMLDDMSYALVPPAGNLTHGTVSEETYTAQADTYGRMFSLTRRDIINDDMGILDDIRARLGRGAAQKFNDVFWTEFMSNASTFWTLARTNYIEGSTTNLGTDGVGLGLGVKAFRQMVSTTADGSKRIGGRPEILLVPPELEAVADNLYANRNLGNVKVADANIYAGKYRPVVSPWLSDSTVTGYSTTAWFLLRNPSVAAAVVVSFLNGQMAPTVESADADFSTLGIQFRGYHDFGVDQADYLCGVKSKGAA